MRIYSAAPPLAALLLLVPTSTAELPMRRLGTWTTSGADEPRREVVRDAQGWAETWAELELGPRPPVDFAHEAALVVALGTQPSAGHEVRIERVVTGGDGHAVVEVVVRHPDHSCRGGGAPDGETAPVDVVGVAAGEVRSWEFAERREVRSCATLGRGAGP